MEAEVSEQLPSKNNNNKKKIKMSEDRLSKMTLGVNNSKEANVGTE